MKTDMEIRSEGLKALTQQMGQVDAERFITLVLREPFDYTKWQEHLFEDKTVDEISRAAMKARESQKI